MITIFVQGGKITKFFAKTPKQEKIILQKLIRFLESENNIILCYYSGKEFDERMIKNRIEYYNLKTDLTVTWFDLKNTISKSMVLPIADYGLKNTAKTFGFTFNFPEYDGMKIAMLYMRMNNKKSAKKLKNPRQILKLIDKYTDDDVKSLDYLIKKLMTDFKKKIIKIDFSPKPIPLMQKKEYKILKKFFKDGYSVPEICEIFGKTDYYVKKRLGLLPEKSMSKYRQKQDDDDHEHWLAGKN
jgi:DNA polymerase elongation subunit (family B)